MKVHFNILICFILSFIFTGVFGELKLVNVLFRHGDRTPGNFIKSCPNDPHGNKTFYPVGFGGLTNKGKRRVFSFGKILRYMYDDFLGSIYTTNEVEAMSSDSPRARMSLQMILTALYPPSDIQQWHEEMNWQPVLMSYKSSNEDTFFVPQNCEMYRAEYANVLNSAEFQSLVESFKPFMEKLGKDMGRTSPISIKDMNHLYHTFDAEKSMNLSVPDWASDIFPDGILREGAILQYLLYGYNEKLRRLSGGVILHKMIIDMKNAQSKSAKSNYKIHLHAGHELNIVMLLQALGLYADHIPEYSSSIIIELHEINDQFYVKVLYYSGIPAQIEVKQIKGCTEFCPFNKFINLLTNVIPTERELKCNRINS